MMSVKEKSKHSRKRPHSQSESGSESEHELFYYHSDRVQLMKEVLKILKLKKIKALAPPSIKKMDMEEINTLLLEELLGISNKRLQKILQGQNADDESSSSDEDKTEIISLDSISDDEICFVDETKDDSKQREARRERCRRKKHKIKKENENNVKVKPEFKAEKGASKDKTTKGESPGLQKDKLLSVLELLELQARARAIRSQLALEAENKAKEAVLKAKEIQNVEESDDDDAIIIETPEVNEIVISSSDSEEGEGPGKPVTGSNSKEMVSIENGHDQVEITEIQEECTASTSKTPENHIEATNSSKKKVKLISSILVEPNQDNTETLEETGKESREVTSSQEINICEIPLPESTDEDNKEEGNIVTKYMPDEEIEKEVTNETLRSNLEEENEESKENDCVVISIKDQDNDDDVIHLDVVEIDGIDD